ncbi:MAG: ferrous iron transport protein B, partial [Erysipelotrichaceae bacterium]|nr:ferrous iron transport protein B [Erysipelotrichaceae bacterium]
MSEIRIALAGNPNCGKTTLFNALTGSNQYVGNWPGVTVEKKEGKLKGHADVTIQDLPGIYSLSPYTLEEVVSRNYLVGDKPDVILNIIDGTNLERNLYLTTQLAETGIPMVIAMNMMDLVKKAGDDINIAELSKRLGCKIVEISALKGQGIKKAAEEAILAAKTKSLPTPMTYTKDVEGALTSIESYADLNDAQKRWYAVKLFEKDEKVLEDVKLSSDVQNSIASVISKVEDKEDDDSEAIITNERYEYIAALLKNVYVKKNAGKLSISDKIDKIVTNRWLALPIFAAVMFFIYWVAVATLGTVVTDWTNDVLFGEWIQPAVQGLLESAGAADWVVSLVVDGIIGGIAAPVGFAPQMAIVFFFLSVLEDCGYMTRVAFIMDRIFRKFGLSGKSFIPMLIGSGCGVPGIMASRTIENDRDRKMTIMTTTFIPCGAKLPFIAMVAGAIFGGASWVAPSAYFLGIAAIICSGIILKKTKMFAGDPAPFVMELPAYHIPTVGNVLRSMWERGWSFIKKAGTIILLSTIVVWFTTYFGFTDDGFRMLAEDEIDMSILAKIGSAICWIFTPLGWGNWQAAVASITG